MLVGRELCARVWVDMNVSKVRAIRAPWRRVRL